MTACMPNTPQILQPRSGKSISILATLPTNHKILLKAIHCSIDTWLIVLHVIDTDHSPSTTKIKGHLGNRNVYHAMTNPVRKSTNYWQRYSYAESILTH